MGTVAEALEKIRAPKPRDEESEQVKIDILESLPMDMYAPSVYASTGGGMCGTRAHVTFRGPTYDPGGTFKPAEAFEVVEAAGWRWLPSTLAKWANYRPSPWPGHAEELPEKNGRDELTDSWPIAPVWGRPEQHGRSKLVAHYAVGDVLVKASVELPGGLLGITAARTNYKGGWEWKKDTGRNTHPESWLYLQDPDSNANPVGEIDSRASFAYAAYCSPHALDGRLYWTMYVEPWNLSPAAIVRQLIEGRERALCVRND